MEEVVRIYRDTGFIQDGVDLRELSEYLISNVFPMDRVDVLDHGYVSLKNVSPFPVGEYGCDYSIVEAARVSFGCGIKDIQSDTRLISFLKKNRHTSPFEHIIFTFTIKCPIFVARHIMRHRTFSFNEISARYTEVDEEFYIPNIFRKQSTSNRQCSTSEEVDESIYVSDQMRKSYDMSYSVYCDLLDKGVAREQARMVLPQGIYTTFVATANLNNWLHFLSLRDAPDSQAETTMYAKAIRNIIQKYTPISSSV